VQHGAKRVPGFIRARFFARRQKGDERHAVFGP
jgi:hypothetical protein